MNLGFGVAKPYGDSQRFDFILRSGSKLSRVQVKSTTTLLNGLYRINAHRRIGGRAIAYLPSEVDFLVAYIIPEQVFFILPIRDILNRTSLLFCPQRLPPGWNQRALPRSLAPPARDQVTEGNPASFGAPKPHNPCHPERNLSRARARQMSRRTCCFPIFRVPHPFAHFAKGWVTVNENPGHETTVEGHGF